MQKRGQTAFEYILLVGGAILFVTLIMLITRGNSLGKGEVRIGETGKDITDQLNSIHKDAPKISNIIVTVGSGPLAGKLKVDWNTDILSTSSLYARHTITNAVKTNGTAKLELKHSISISGLTGGSAEYKLTSCISEGICGEATGTANVG
ncbi:class III signal peptide-containing protein [Candidatus Micrarchaeota archaeon]|nr:class III signal peptide-containing protein [Candidatus Micrarchaeota archaeon]